MRSRSDFVPSCSASFNADRASSRSCRSISSRASRSRRRRSSIGITAARSFPRRDTIVRSFPKAARFTISGNSSRAFVTLSRVMDMYLSYSSYVLYTSISQEPWELQAAPAPQSILDGSSATCALALGASSTSLAFVRALHSFPMLSTVRSTVVVVASTKYLPGARTP